jgi:hypothetical protein
MDASESFFDDSTQKIDERYNDFMACDFEINC